MNKEFGYIIFVFVSSNLTLNWMKNYCSRVTNWTSVHSDWNDMANIDTNILFGTLIHQKLLDSRHISAEIVKINLGQWSSNRYSIRNANTRIRVSCIQNVFISAVCHTAYHLDTLIDDKEILLIWFQGWEIK